ncbi:MAG: hypothetical protein Q9174_003199 [Haloplaca sp. 1 TL-2023]
MDPSEDEDMYAPEDIGDTQVASIAATNGSALPADNKLKPGDLEEGEEEDAEEDESDSDIDIIVEAKNDPKPDAVAPTPRPNAPKGQPLRVPSTATDIQKGARSPAIKVESNIKATPTGGKPGASYPAVRTSSIDVDAKPIHGPTGKPITQVDMDADFSEDDKPWRRPGTDMTDYFNYGFDEFTWASYCLKQDSVRKEVADTKKQMEDMQNMMNVPGGMPGIPAVPGAPSGQGGMPTMPGMEGMPPELQQMMQQMMSQGMDPTQVSPEMMMQMMATGQQGGSNQHQGPGQGFGGGQNYQQQNQNQGFGYGGGGPGGGRGGRGGGGRRW